MDVLVSLLAQYARPLFDIKNFNFNFQHAGFSCTTKPQKKKKSRIFS